MPDRRLCGLDLLRSGGMVVVLLHHLPIRPSVFSAFDSHSWLAMNLFFVLSGYLIASPFFRAWEARHAGMLGNFYLRRFFKLAPLYWVMLIIYWAIDLLPEADSLPLWRYLTLTQNFGMKAQDVFSESWSVAVEAHFYLFFPILALFFLAPNQEKRVPHFFAGVLLGGMLVRHLAWTHLPLGRYSVWTELHIPTYCRMDGLLFGVAAAVIEQFQPQTFARLKRRPLRLTLVGTLLLACLMIWGGARHGYFCSVFGLPLSAFAFALILLGALSPATALGRHRVWGVSALAIISYSTYLSHKLVYDAVLTVIAWMQWDGLAPALQAAICGAAAIAAGGLLYFAVERPFLILRERCLRN